MDEPRIWRTPALEAAAAPGQTLHDALVHLELAISSPAGGPDPRVDRPGDKEMVGAPRRLRAAHDRDREARRALRGDHGARAAPRRQIPAPGRAPDDRRSRSARCSRASRAARSPRTPRGRSTTARDDLQRLLGQIVRHRQSGADLVWEAYNVDIGGTE